MQHCHKDVAISRLIRQWRRRTLRLAWAWCSTSLGQYRKWLLTIIYQVRIKYASFQNTDFIWIVLYILNRFIIGIIRNQRQYFSYKSKWVNNSTQVKVIICHQAIWQCCLYLGDNPAWASDTLPSQRLLSLGGGIIDHSFTLYFMPLKYYTIVYTNRRILKTSSWYFLGLWAKFWASPLLWA